MSSGYVLEARRAAPRIGELFAGYGGLGMGVQAEALRVMAGWQVAA